MADYLTKLAHANPQEAVQIAIAEAEREKALAAKARSEYQALAELEFDDKCRIVRANLGGLYRLAQFYAASELVPEIYRRKPNDCFIAVQMAYRLRVDPFAYMQTSYVVYGKPGIEAKLAVSMINTQGKIIGRLKYKEERDPKTNAMVSCTAFATDAETRQEVTGPTVTWAIVKAEGWLDKKGSKWQTIPEVMFAYRAAMWLIRKHYPEVLMGMQTVDEIVDSEPEAPPEPPPSRGRHSLREKNGNGVHQQRAIEVLDATVDLDAEPVVNPEQSIPSETASEPPVVPEKKSRKPKTEAAAELVAASKPASGPIPLDNDGELASEAQLAQLKDLAGNVSGDECDMLLDGYGVGKAEELTHAQADDLIARLQRVKERRKPKERREPGEDG